MTGPLLDHSFCVTVESGVICPLTNSQGIMLVDITFVDYISNIMLIGPGEWEIDYIPDALQIHMCSILWEKTYGNK